MRLLVIGQTPPPFYGQSINIGKMLDVLRSGNTDIRFVRLNFSDETSEVGSINGKKIVRLLLLLLRICKELIFFRPEYVYYPPAGPDKTPILRDFILLFPVKLFKFPVIFHYHAGGLSQAEKLFKGLARKLFRFIYYRADYSICLSNSGRIDPENLQSKNIVIQPTGVEDTGAALVNQQKNDQQFVVLFAAVCRESKGIIDFISIIRECRKECPAISGHVIGSVFSPVEDAAISAAVDENILRYDGIQTGDAKKSIFADADLFLFPSFYESENFPTVILEAFSCGLPVVSTKWRGIADQVKDGVNGFLHEVHDVSGMAYSVKLLYKNRVLYKKNFITGKKGFQRTLYDGKICCCHPQFFSFIVADHCVFKNFSL